MIKVINSLGILSIVLISLFSLTVLVGGLYQSVVFLIDGNWGGTAVCLGSLAAASSVATKVVVDKFESINTQK